jgi:hypothetical protein
MSIRGTVWLQIGDPFDGPRFGPPLHLEWAAKDTDTFQDLELLIADVYKTIATQPTTAWEQLAETAQPPKINGRRVKFHLRLFANDLEEYVLMRACLPFPAWPLGGWVLIEGWKRTREGAWTPLSTDELEKAW